MDRVSEPADRKSAALRADWGTIAEEHEALRAAMARIDAACRDDRSRDELALLLAQFAEVLREHFRHEERDEYFGAAFLHDPLVRGRIDQLIVQHHGLLARLSAIQRALAELPAGEHPTPIGAELASLFSALRWHDAVETSLMRRLQATT